MKTNRFLSLAATFAIALTFFACSGEQADLGGEPSSNSTGGQQGNQVFCQLTAGTCSQKSFSACMELVNAEMAEIVPNCDIWQSSSSDTQSSSSSSEQLFSSSQSSSSLAEQFSSSSQSSSSLVEQLSSSLEQSSSAQGQSSSSINGWITISGQNWWTSTSSDPWIFYNKSGSVTLNSEGGVKFSAVSGSTQDSNLQLSQDGHNLKTGDCYRIKIRGRTDGGLRDIKLGFQQNSEQSTSYWESDFSCGMIPSFANPQTGCYYDGSKYDVYAYITDADANARFYINAGSNSTSILMITDLAIEKVASSTNQSTCLAGGY